MLWLRIKEFVVNYDMVLFMSFVAFGWVFLYTFFILLSVFLFAIK